MLIIIFPFSLVNCHNGEVNPPLSLGSASKGLRLGQISQLGLDGGLACTIFLGCSPILWILYVVLLGETNTQKHQHKI
jgi:hypothetical protein